VTREADGVVYSPRGEWGYYDRGHRVLVITPRDPYYGHVGVVTGAYNDAGDMVHRVAFDGGNTAESGDYFTDELVSAQGGGKRVNQQTVERD
jgi:hypothetical protein